ncbi:cupin domain-containing protein [Oceanospirillum beijerinckii]|uniref:cupin domain-containing protein n=1 Tax=Oceanospirillum beijerinckii TaxID=64976 RepID=UPI00041712EE|nr:cupin domain-containing protein [Oceanospirillum beijerinckii]
MLNMDFSKRVVLDTRDQNWVASPMAGVWRKPLAREEAERGHATSIVRYEPGARFSPHDHPKGEEILVLEGTFSDESGDYPAGSYFRNPEGFRHGPFSEEGCIILVKLHQFQPDDSEHVCIDTQINGLGSCDFGGSDSAERQRIPLHRHNQERVALEFWPAGTEQDAAELSGGEELYIIKGELIDDAGRYTEGHWVRNPIGFQCGARKVEQDTLFWRKTGHL